MIGLFGSIMFPPFLLLWQFHWCIPGWSLFITLAQRCELCRTKLCITYFSMLLKPPCNLLLIDRRRMNLLFLLWFHFLVSMLVTREFIFLRMVRTVIYIGNMMDSNILQQLLGISPADEFPTQVSFIISFWNM